MSATRHGFTLVEAAICALVVALMGVAAGSAVAVAGRSREELRTRAIANAAAEQILAEVVSKAFDDPQTPDAPAGLDVDEDKNDRFTFDDIDDYGGLTIVPIQDPRGNLLAPKAMEAGIDVVALDPATMERSASRTGLALVQVRITLDKRVIVERTAYRARTAEGLQ